jgi:hypothetical protein
MRKNLLMVETTSEFKKRLKTVSDNFGFGTMSATVRFLVNREYENMQQKGSIQNDERRGMRLDEPVTANAEPAEVVNG